MTNPGHRRRDFFRLFFDKEKEQNRLKAAQLIGEIGSQAGDIARTQGQIIATRAANEKMSGATQADRDRALAELKAKDPTKQYSARDVNNQVYSNLYKQAFAESGFGTGGKVQRAISAVTAAVQGLSGGNVAQALSGAAAPYVAEKIHELTTDAKGKVNTEANLMAHAVLGAVTSYAAGNSALAGASGAAMGEYIAQQLYPGVKRDDLSEVQRQTISALGTLAAGLAGGVVGDSTADVVAGAQAGKNAIEQNHLHVSEKTELELAKQKLQNSKDPAEREQAQQKINELNELNISRDKKVLDACGNGNAGSAACAGARLKVIAVKSEYETGSYNSKISQQYADAYGNIVNLLNITSVDAQNQQQVKDALTQYAMDVLGVDRQTARGYAETKQGMDIIFASVTPILGSAAASKLGSISTEASTKASLLKEMTSQGIKYTPENIVQVAKDFNGKIVFLETGNNKAGLQHIINEHAKDFANIGVSEAQIPNVVMNAVSEGKVVGYQEKGTGRPIYETVINGEVHRLAITVSSNGFMVGANPAGRLK